MGFNNGFFIQQQSGSLGYKVYTALLTQSGTNAPVATILENTLGGVPVWSYDDVGMYTLTLLGEFTVGKTIIIPPANSLNPIPFGFPANSDWYAVGSDNADTIYLLNGKVTEQGVYTLDNDCLYGAGYSSIEIRVYP